MSKRTRAGKLPTTEEIERLLRLKQMGILVQSDELQQRGEAAQKFAQNGNRALRRANKRKK